jgi:hypothetical protein
MVTRTRRHTARATPLGTRIQQALDEARVILPGTQALLGFQLVAFFQQRFDALELRLQYAHVISLALVLVTIVLLMSLPAYHRLVEKGAETESFHSYASTMLVAALGALSVALSIDVYVVVSLVTEKETIALICGLACLAMSFGLWFGFTFVRRLANVT